MRQPTDPEKLKALSKYHHKLKELFKKGKLEGKIWMMLRDKAQEIGISLSKYTHRKAV